VGNGIHYFNKRLYWTSKKFTKSLQCRYRQFETDVNYRNRWEKPQTKKMEIYRQKKNRNINFIGVDSIKILERRNRQQYNGLSEKNTSVYDLEVVDNHNYFANNILVSNCHVVSNPQAQRTKIINDIATSIERVWLLSGTPMTSRPMNYYNLLNIVGSPVAANWMAYAIRYCNGFQFSVGKRKVWNVTGASNLDELRERTSTHILRRLKEEVLDLPEKIITPVYLRLKSKDYEELMGEYFDWYDKNPEESSSLTIQFGKLMKVRKVIAQEKINNTIELAENIIEQGKKVIIFTNFTDTLNQIYNHFGKSAVYLDGSCSKFHRQNAVDEFQTNDKIKVFVGNLKAAGVGITLTSAEAVIMNDLSFVPAEHSQAEDRSHRIGQKNSTSVYYPLFENTIEGAIYDILSRKKKIISTVMGDDMFDEASTIEEMLNLISGNR
jgi:SWI/SNF-related matrix-associated actin-dependent regulator 1 of chromatin subfamily A